MPEVTIRQSRDSNNLLPQTHSWHHFHGLWFSSFSRGLQGLGQCRSHMPAAAFHLLHWTPRACSPAAALGPWALFWSRCRCKWEILLEIKKSLLSKEVSISTPYHTQNEKSFSFAFKKSQLFQSSDCTFTPLTPEQGHLPFFPNLTNFLEAREAAETVR